MKKTILPVFVLLISSLTGSSWANPFVSPGSGQNHSNLSNTSKAQSICNIDISESPQMANFARGLYSLCDNNYAEINKKLNLDNFKAPAKISLIFKENLANVGETLGNTISLDSKWFSKHPDDLGAIVHEFAHVAQSYPQDPEQPFWITEGIADYIRYWRGYKNSWSYPHCDNKASNHYTSGYWCSAAFLGFVEKNYDKQIIGKLNKNLREKTYNDNLFKKYTGYTLENLWQKCREKDCTGGKV